MPAKKPTKAAPAGDEMKWVNIRIPAVLKSRYDAALLRAKEENNRHIFSPEIVVPAIKAFCEATEAGQSAGFLNGQYVRQ